MLRTDDIVCQVSVATCLERMAQTMFLASKMGGPWLPGIRSLIAPQDEAYMAAGLFGVWAGMRNPLPQASCDVRVNGNRRLDLRIFEVVRTTRLARLAPPQSVFVGGPVLLDSNCLVDDANLTHCDTWFRPAIGKTVHQVGGIVFF